MAPFRYALALLGAVASAGCGMSLPKGARSLFSATHTCPAEGVTVQPRPDVPRHSLLTAQRSAKPIPPEVAANPERLALWNKMHPSADADLDRAGTTYEVSGCGHTTLYVCDHPSVAVSLDKIIASQIAGQIDPTHAAAMTDKAAEGGCAKEAARVFDPLGWVPVFDPAQPHELVTRSDCSGGATIATVNDIMYVLLPSRARDEGTRVETPDGELIDQLQALPLTLACPSLDEAQCIEAVKEYSTAHFVGQIVGSAELAAYVAQQRPPR